MKTNSNKFRHQLYDRVGVTSTSLWCRSENYRYDDKKKQILLGRHFRSWFVAM